VRGRVRLKFLVHIGNALQFGVNLFIIYTIWLELEKYLVTIEILLACCLENTAKEIQGQGGW